VLSATAVANPHLAKPASPLFDTLDDRVQDAPRIAPSGGSFNDATAVTIEPRLYGRADSICYAIDNAKLQADSPKYKEPIVLNHPATIRAAVLGADGKLGPEAKVEIKVDDRTPPSIVKAEAAFGQPIAHLMFSEPLEKSSATVAANYQFEPKMAVRSAELSSDRRVVLTL